MTTNYLELRQHLEDRLAQFGRELPGPMTGFARLRKKAVEDGALSAKVKEMMALAISIVVGCDGCVAYHTKMAHQHGATREEVLETIALAIYMGGGPAAVYGTDTARAYDQFSVKS